MQAYRSPRDTQGKLHSDPGWGLLRPLQKKTIQIIKTD